MGEVINLPKPKVQHVMIDFGDKVTLIPLADIRGLAEGRLSVAEFDEPERVARLIATICMSYLDGPD